MVLIQSVRPQLLTYEAFQEYARSCLDWDALEVLRERHANAGSERKYLEPWRWFQKKWHAVELLGLDQARPLRILDLGTGAGHFPFICRFLGHDVEALDQPGLPIYDDLCRWLDVAKTDFRIEPQGPLPDFGGRFDLVTAFMVGFDTRPDGDLYDLDDWLHFLEGTARQLVNPEGGRLCLKLIGHPNRKGLKFGDESLMALFERYGARFEAGRYAIFDPLTA